MNVYKGAYMQRGYGLGGTFAKFFRWAIPLIRPASASVGNKALNMASDIADDVSVGKTWSQPSD
jgi:hypothetical protein